VDWVGDWSSSGARDGVGTKALLDDVQGITSHGGFVYITDNHAVRRVDTSSGAVATIAGALGAAGGEDGPGHDARFDRPEGIATNGRVVWIADRGNSQIRVLDLETLMVSTLAGRYRQEGRNDGAAETATFKGLSDLTFGGTDLYVVEIDNSTVRRINVSSGSVLTVAGGIDPGLADGLGASARFKEPKGIEWIGPGALIVADTGNDRPREMGVSGGEMNRMNVTSRYGTEAGYQDGIGTGANFNEPRGLAYTGTALLVADAGNAVVRSIDLAKRAVTTLAGAAGDERHVVGVGTEARFKNMTDLHFDKETGDVFIADGSVLRRMYFE
jgi:hypothetical protein